MGRCQKPQNEIPENRSAGMISRSHFYTKKSVEFAVFFLKTINNLNKEVRVIQTLLTVNTFTVAYEKPYFCEIQEFRVLLTTNTRTQLENFKFPGSVRHLEKSYPTGDKVVSSLQRNSEVNDMRPLQPIQGQRLLGSGAGRIDPIRIGFCGFTPKKFEKLYAHLNSLEHFVCKKCLYPCRPLHGIWAMVNTKEFRGRGK